MTDTLQQIQDAPKFYIKYCLEDGLEKSQIISSKTKKEAIQFIKEWFLSEGNECHIIDCNKFGV